MRDMTKNLEDVVGEGESSPTILDDPDIPLIIKILLSSLKLPLSIKTEIKEEVKTAEEKRRKARRNRNSGRRRRTGQK